MGTAKFAVNDLVRKSNDPEQSGVVRELQWNEATESWHYFVQFGTQRKKLPEESLERVGTHDSPWDLLARGTCAGRHQFVMAMTHHRLNKPPSRIAKSFAATRAQFFPHQFKPLLKFLDHPQKRLLIADDVGLGKTIEAGYILRELHAQDAAHRVLILVPARLTTKWKRELESRFGEHFDVVRGSQLVEFANRFERKGSLESFRWIVSYESARDPVVRETWSRSGVPIDLFVADEAHRMRNASTGQHRVGAAFSEVAETAVFLSATPVQNGLDDLRNLLKLLSPEEFRDPASFNEMMQANGPIIKAQAALKAQPPLWSEVDSSLDAFERTAAGKQLAGGRLWQSIRQRVGSRPKGRRDVVALLSDVSLLSPTSHVISRTRKAEAMVQRAQRHARWYDVELTASERDFYKGVADLCLLAGKSTWANQMAVLMAYRMTASCIPAAVRYFRERLEHAGSTSLDNVIEEDDGGEESSSNKQELLSWSMPLQQSLSDLAAAYGGGSATDSKLKCLLDALEAIARDDRERKVRPRKVVLFSFFRRTLEYLDQALRGRGYSVRLMHGGFGLAERETAIDEFLTGSDVQILLTSDVGGEGLDLQRASVLINYDLPWNPMVVEQRIGRIDRIGQESERIQICNLVVADSIEGRILQRLLDKIGIFRSSIGELEPIVGEQLQKLTEHALTGALSERELEEKLREEEGAFVASQHDARNVLERVDGLLAADQGLVDEINAVVGERQLPTDRELLAFINDTLRSEGINVELPDSVLTSAAALDLGGALSMKMEDWGLAAQRQTDGFPQRAQHGLIRITLSREVALRAQNVELISLQHPLISFLVDRRKSATDRVLPAYFLRLQKSSVLRSGSYAFLTHLLEVGGNRRRNQFATVIVDLKGQALFEEQEVTGKVLLELLDSGLDAEVQMPGPEHIDAAKSALTRAMDKVVSSLCAEETTVARDRVEQQQAARRTTAELRVERAELNVASLQQKGAGEFAQRMARGRLEKERERLQRVLSEVVATETVPIEEEAVAVGVFVVD